MTPQNRVHIQEVAPRDGLQIEAAWVPTDRKIAWIDELSRTGVSKIEVTSFVSPKAVPALRDAEAVVRGIERRPGVRYAALVPNETGAERAIGAGIDEINYVMSASETHNRANLRMARADSFRRLADVARLLAGTRISLNGSIATAFGCPFEGPQPLERVLDQADRFAGSGCSGITLADTTGMANPRQVRSLVEAVKARLPGLELTLHFHNTRGCGLANVLAAFEAGADRFDAALGGLGGCPFAPGATGNVCTEDVVNMFEEMGVATGVDLDRLIEISRWLPDLVGHEVPGQVRKAGRPQHLHPVPEGVCVPQAT
jgi:hydroxymethylglutaryl-CoA lyase